MKPVSPLRTAVISALLAGISMALWWRVLVPQPIATPMIAAEMLTCLVGVFVAVSIAAKRRGQPLVASGPTCDPPAVASHRPVPERAIVPPVPDAAPSAQPPGGAPQSLRGARVLVVDDAEENRSLLRLVLERAGVLVEVCEDGLQAVNLVAANEFDAILMDVQMPVMDGREAARRIRQTGLTLPIIALTAESSAESETQCREAGCTHFLTKPICFDRTAAVLRSALQGTADDVSPAATSDAGSRTSSSEPETQGLLTSSLPAHKPRIQALLRSFSEKLPRKLAEMEAALEGGDLDQLSALAHWLKGSGPNMGYAAFADPALRLEQLARDGETQQIPDTLRRLHELAARIRVSADVNAKDGQPAEAEQSAPMESTTLGRSAHST